ncbi:MAG: iron-containing alcohol dehydrogenase [Armatimonadetes bacterium]|nr:iron-containing alcohol dehydrogenase [Armatimonadota bacterium]
MKPFEFYLPTKLLFGPGSVAKLPETVSGLGRKALLVTYSDGSMRTAGTLDKVLGLLEEAQIAVVVDEGVDPTPGTAYVDRMAQVARAEGCSAVVGLGGGSAMDAAKAIALSATNTTIREYLLGGDNWLLVGAHDPLPIITVTTTSGTGSEVTCVAVLTDDESHQKRGVLSRSLYPTVSIVDPELMLSMPRGVTAVTGVDALFHALEAFLSRGANAYSDLVGTEALRLIVANLETVFQDGSNLEARANMAWACTLAGMAFDNANCVAIHAIGQGIGTHTNASHGKTCAVVGPAYLRYTYQSAPARYAAIARLLGVPAGSLSEMELAQRSGDALQAFLARVDLDMTASSLGVTEDMIPAIVEEVFLTMRALLEASLAPLDKADAAEILRLSM